RLRWRSTRLICSSMPVGRMFMSVFLFLRRRLAGVVVAASTDGATGYRSQESAAAELARLHDELSGVLAVEEHVDRRRQLLEAFDDGLERSEPALGDQAGDLADRVGRTSKMVEHDETLQRRALYQQ